MNDVEHPVWCEPTRCSVGSDRVALKGVHRSVALTTQYDRHSGNEARVHLWSYDETNVYVQLEFPGSMEVGIELTPEQGQELGKSLLRLLIIER